MCVLEQDSWLIVPRVGQNLGLWAGNIKYWCWYPSSQNCLSGTKRPCQPPGWGPQSSVAGGPASSGSLGSGSGNVARRGWLVCSPGAAANSAVRITKCRATGIGAQDHGPAGPGVCCMGRALGPAGEQTAFTGTLGIFFLKMSP